MEELLKYFPNEISNILKSKINYKTCEIRLRTSKPIILREREEDIVLEYIVKQEEVLETLERLCENSIYAYKNQLSQGFITIKGGHRIGVIGTAVIENEKIINMKYISSLNFRIAREVKGSADKYLNQILDINNKTIYNTLIVSPPGKGKTTVLRDLIRTIASGIPRNIWRANMPE